MDTHNRTDVSSQVSSTCGDCQVFYRVEPICINHEIPVIFIYSWGFASISVVEELRECLSFDIVDLVHVEPRAVTWENYGVCL